MALKDSKDNKKYLIPINNEYYETTKEIYDVFYKMKRREKYLEERDIKNGLVNFSDFSNNYYASEELLKDDKIDIENEVITNLLLETVLEAISTLNNEEQEIIQELFFCGKSERVLAIEKGISKTAIHYRKECILNKIRAYIKI